MEAINFYRMEMQVKNSVEKGQKQDNKDKDFLDVLKNAPDKAQENSQQEQSGKEEKREIPFQSLYFMMPQQMQTVSVSPIQSEAIQISMQENAQSMEAVPTAEGSQVNTADVMSTELVMPLQNAETVLTEAQSEVVPVQKEQATENTANIRAEEAAKGVQLQKRQNQEPVQPIKANTGNVSEYAGDKKKTGQNQSETKAEAMTDSGIEKGNYRKSEVVEAKELDKEETGKTVRDSGEEGIVYENPHGTLKVSNEKASVTSPQVLQVSKPEELPQEVTKELLVKTQAGQKEFEIQITPENLGKITVKVLYEKGVSTVSIVCSEKKTMELLAQSAKEIGTVMEQNLGKPTEVYVEKQEADNLWQEQQGNDHAGRESEQRRQKEEAEKMKTAENGRFLQELRLGLI
ncbi:MAG TPA: flagellar hook-length control protein FliK [Candidatus Blautia stercoravium]|nr:flagellar hook-length control protein FliK [Candidatus Blautia stercoravium]